MKYAVIQVAGSQFRVQEGDVIESNRLTTEVGQNLTVSDVLLIVDGKKTQIGTPLVKGASVTLKLVDNVRGEKIRVAVYKAKSRYSKVRGHRQSLSRWEVVSIS